MSRHHHRAHHVNDHHWSKCIHAPCVLHQGSGHLSLGQLRLCLPVCVGIRCCQLPVHRPGPPGAQDERAGTISGLFLLYAIWCCCEKSSHLVCIINKKRQPSLLISQTSPELFQEFSSSRAQASLLDFLQFHSQGLSCWHDTDTTTATEREITSKNNEHLHPTVTAFWKVQYIKFNRSLKLLNMLFTTVCLCSRHCSV